MTLGQRAVFYARCRVLEDLAYGLQRGRDKYLDKSLAAMAWLFPEWRHNPHTPTRQATNHG